MEHRVYSAESHRPSASEDSLEIPDFPPSVGATSASFRKRYLHLAIIMTIGMTIVAAGLVLDLVFRQSGSDPLVEIAILTLFPFFYAFMYLLSRARDFYLQGGLLHLPLPIRRSGKRTWEVPLRDVVHVRALRHEDGDTGVLFELNDGAQARVWLSDMPPGGQEFLELLLQNFGT
jgi:hypothetical protein